MPYKEQNFSDECSNAVSNINISIEKIEEHKFLLPHKPQYFEQRKESCCITIE